MSLAPKASIHAAAPASRALLVGCVLIGELGLEADQRSLGNADLGAGYVDFAGGGNGGGVERHQLVTDLDSGGLDFEGIATAVCPVAGGDDAGIAPRCRPER